MSLKLGENSQKIRLEQPGNVGVYEAIEAERVRAEPFELFSDDETLFAHLFLAPPYRQARARRL